MAPLPAIIASTLSFFLLFSALTQESLFAWLWSGVRDSTTSHGSSVVQAAGGDDDDGVLGLARTGVANIPEVMEFEEFKRAFGRHYAADEEEPRRAAFEANKKFIMRHNAKANAGRTSFRCGVNDFTDMFQDEFRQRYFGYTPSNFVSPPVSKVNVAPPPAVDWRAKGAVTSVKNQGSCGSCWAFATTGSLEGAYQIATGALRVLSEQQLIDCSRSFGNKGCSGGAMVNAYQYIISNKGLDDEKEYNYTGGDSEMCWTAAEKRDLATMSSFKSVPPGSEEQLVAAVALGPVAVAIEADQPAFQHYKSGVFDSPCGTKLDHGVLVVGYDATSYTVKNSWGPGWGEQGYIRIKRGSNMCGISNDASYPTVVPGKPLPVPPPTSGKRPELPCQCTSNCLQMCKQFGMWCCGGAGGNCNCMPPSSCPQCNPSPPDGPYGRCAGNGDCESGAECVNINGISGSICMPGCKGYGSACPAPSAKEATTARPYCDACVSSANAGTESPNSCILVCNSSSTDVGDYSEAECGAGATCKPLNLDKDPCDNGSKWPTGAHPCQATKTCGVCTFP